MDKPTTLLGMAKQMHELHPDKFVIVRGRCDEGLYKFENLTVSDTLNKFFQQCSEKYWTSITNVQYEEDGTDLGSITWLERKADPELVKGYNTYFCDGPLVIVFGYSPQLQLLLQPTYDAEQAVREQDHPKFILKSCQEMTLEKRRVRQAREQQQRGILNRV